MPGTRGVALASTGVTVQRSGMALVTLDCLGIASCNGALTLTAKSPLKPKIKNHNRKKTTTITIGTASFSISGGEAKTVKIKLDGAGRALLEGAQTRLGATLSILQLVAGVERTKREVVTLVGEKVHGKTKK
jgi:hypothetical protein